MKFIDEALINVKAGDGGSGCKHFRREKYIPLGGPDGGDGGQGGSIILRADRNKTTLLDFHFQPRWQAQDGQDGQGANKEGKSGKDLVISVPVGTEIYRLDGPAGSQKEQKDKDGELWTDLDDDDQTFVVANGGRGGRGNAFFKSPTNRAPEHFQAGEKGEEISLRLSLKLVAEVGLIGFPNAGKSTLISRISSARPKIADYPFTTLTPNLGVARSKGGRTFVVADIPGLIPGAHQGKGLGIKFLKHVERTRVLAHLIDPHQLDESGNRMPPQRAFQIINEELALFSQDLSEKPQVVVLTKLDSVSDRQEITEAIGYFADMGIAALAISSASGEGVPELLTKLASLLP